MFHYIMLAACAVMIGAYGSLIGAGGGFLLVPLLLLLYPYESPEVITGISLSVVFIEAVAASIAYGKKKRIDYKSGLLLAIPTIPGAILGAVSTFYASRQFFEILFSVILISLALYLMAKQNYDHERHKNSNGTDWKSGCETTLCGWCFPFSWKLGAVTSFLVGYLASLLGIGGGIIYVPIMVYLLHFPIKIATATSLFIIAIRACAGALTHIPMGSIAVGLPRIASLAVGVYIGAHLGAHFSHRIHSKWIFRALTLALIIVGVRILAEGLLGVHLAIPE